MADVRSGRRSGGQLIVVTALALATVFVLLALVLNTAIFTENRATRTAGETSTRPVEFVDVAVDSVGTTVDDVNAGQAGTGYTALRDGHLDSTVETLEADLATRFSLDRESTTLELVDAYEGTRIAEDDGSTGYRSAAGATDWTVVVDAEIRNVGFTVDTDSLPSVPESEVESVLSGGGDGAFVVGVTDDEGHTDRVAFYERDGDPTVEVYDAATGSYAVCPVGGGETMDVDLSDGTVDGEGCGALDAVVETTGTYTLRYRNGDRLRGTYMVTVDRLEDRLRDDVDRVNGGRACATESFDDAGDGNPYAAPAVYAATVDVGFASGSTEYDTRRRVVPDSTGDPVTPRFAAFDVTDVSTDTDAVFEVTYDAEDPNGATPTVQLALYDSGEKVDETSPGLAPSGTVQLREDGGAGESFEIRTTVGANGEQRRYTEVHVAGAPDCPA